MSDPTVIQNFMRWFESHKSQGNEHTLGNKVLYALCAEAGHEAPKRRLTDQGIFDVVHELVNVADKSPLQQRLYEVLMANSHSTPKQPAKYRKPQIFWTNHGLAWRTADALVSKGIHELWELEYIPESALTVVFSMGQQSIKSVKVLAQKHGLSLGRLVISEAEWSTLLNITRNHKNK